MAEDRFYMREYLEGLAQAAIPPGQQPVPENEPQIIPERRCICGAPADHYGEQPCGH